MKTRFIAITLCALLVTGLLAGCGNSSKVLTQEEAQAVALKDAGISASQASDVHTHIVDQQGIPCYNIHITVGDVTYSYLIAANGGEILESGID